MIVAMIYDNNNIYNDYALNPTVFKSHRVLASILAMLAVSLNYSSILYGVNFSFADFFCILSLMILMLKREVFVPFVPIIFFLVVSITTLITSVFWVPLKFKYSPAFSDIAINYMKLFVVFIYFVLGYNIAKLNITRGFLKHYSLFSFIVGTVGVVSLILNINFLSEQLFFGGLRLKGLMNDPNFFAIIQVSAVVYFSRVKKIKTYFRFLVLFFLIVSILATGSKTGLIALCAYGTLRMLEHLFQSKKNIRKIMQYLLFMIVFVLIIPLIYENIRYIFDTVIKFVPSFSRVEMLFLDYNNALADSGSERTLVWRNAINLIEQSPIIGIGIGTYSGLAEMLFGIKLIAHNTYLQLCAEWGIFLAILLYIYIFSIICKSTIGIKSQSSINLILRDIIIVFLIGSISISFNNARMFWVFLGMLSFEVGRKLKINTGERCCS